MLQHINLTPQEAKPKKQKLNAHQVWGVSALLSMLMVVAIFWGYADYQELLKVAVKIEGDYDRLMAQYEKISGQLAKEIGVDGAKEAEQQLERKSPTAGDAVGDIREAQ